MKKKLCAMLLAVVMLSIFAVTSSALAQYTAGTYTAEVMGMKKMTVETTFSESAIVDIKLTHDETPGIGVPVTENMPAQIIELQGLGMDVVSGATLTSNAIIEGVSNCVEQAGGDVAALKAIKPEVQVQADQEMTADVVVLGAGGAGMAAAVTAHQAGKSVIVIEKTSQMGGNTMLAGGALNAVDEGSELALKNNDSVEFHYTQTFNGGDQQGNPELVRMLVEQAWDGVEWLKSLGMEFIEGETFTVAGGLWPRAHRPVEPEGYGFFKTYQAYMDANPGIEMVYNTKAENLIVENGVVTGAVCTGSTGNTITVKANNGVVLATGGFGQNIEMRQEANKETNLWPNLDESIKSTNTSAITGDGITMAKAVGANLIQMGNIQLLPLGDPNTGSLSGNVTRSVEGVVYINLEGNRFVNEGGRRDHMTKALMEQTNSTMYIVVDSDFFPTGEEKNNFNETMNSLVESGRALKADTLEELAEKMGVPAENMVAAITEHNRHCPGGDLDGEADEFGRTLYADVGGLNDGINTAPFYAGMRVPTVHHTMGGVEINTKTEVIDTNGNVIPGLFAAGEVTGGIHGTNRLGGNALTDTVVFGRIAGTSAAAFTK